MAKLEYNALRKFLVKNMTESIVDKDLSGWYSTYGMVTVQRIIEKYHFELNPKELTLALKTSESFCNRLLSVPLRHVFNGILLQQAYDYQQYAQRLFIDYLLSGESDKPPEAPGALTREDIEGERLNLIDMNNAFHQLELTQETLISDTQRLLIKEVSVWKKELQVLSNKINTSLKAIGASYSEAKVLEALESLLLDYNFKDELTIESHGFKRVNNLLNTTLSSEGKQAFIVGLVPLKALLENLEASLETLRQKAREITGETKQFRTDFYHFILRVKGLFALLPEFKMSSDREKENRELLAFDNQLGNT